jgi:autotransporter passenger strand-loop-strand repeat protein
LLSFLLGSLAARGGLVQTAFAQYTCPSSCTGLTLNGGNMQTVNAGGHATSTTLNGGFQTINSGGTAFSTTINNFGQQGIFTGGAADTTTVNSGGGQFVLGGAATNTTVNDSAFQEVDSGSASGVTVNDFGSQYVSGGAVTSTTVNGGYQEIDGGSVTNTVMRNGSFQNVLGGSADQTAVYDSLQSISGGTASNTVVSGSTAEQDVLGGAAVGTTVIGGSQFVSSGGVASATTLGAGATGFVSSGGVVVDTTVSGGAQYVSSGGSAVDSIVVSGGVQAILQGGAASGTTIGSGGAQNVSSGGIASGTTISSGGMQTLSGGVATNTVVSAGGVQNVLSGSVASATTVSSAGAQILSAGSALSATVASGGTQSVYLGGVASATTLDAGAVQYVNSGGAAWATIVDGGNQQVFSAGVASGTVVGNNGAQTLDGGQAISTIVGSGGAQYVSSGGSAVGTQVFSAGTQSVYASGAASGTSVDSGGMQNVFSGGIASTTTVNNGGTQRVTSGGLAIDTIVNSGGVQTVNSGGLMSGTIVSAGGEQSVASGGVALGSVISSGGIQAVSSGGVVQATAVRRGGVIVNDGTVVFDPTSTTTFEGSLAGNGAVLQRGAGTTVLTGDNHAFAGTTTVASGTLMVGDIDNSNASLGGNVAVSSAGTLRGHGSIGGSVANNGLLMPGGSIGTLTIGGNYAQSNNGTLAIEVSPTSGSQLNVHGAATLGGALHVLYDPGVYSARSYAILTASTISGSFDGLSGATSAGVDLTGLTPSLTYSANEIDLVLAVSPIAIAPRDTSIYTALASTAALGARAFDAALLDHLAAAPAADLAGTHSGTWATLMDGYARADGSGAASAFGAHRSGFAAGFDRGIGQATVGGAIGYEHDEISESATPSIGRLDTLQLAAYGRRMLGPIEASAVFGYGYSWATEKRPLAVGPDGTPEGSDRLQSLSGSAQAGIPFELSRDTVLEPRVGLHWAWLHGHGFAESGGGGQNLTIGPDTVHSAQPYLGLTLMHAFGTLAEPVTVHVDVDYARELANRTRSVTIFAQDGTAFAAPGAPLARQIVSIGAGVRAQIRPSWSVSGDASTQLRMGSMVHLQLSYRF